jgi:hypothetical protein
MRVLIVLALSFCACAGAAGEAKPQPPQPPQSPRPEARPEIGTKLACSRPSDCGAANACCTTPLWDGTRCAARCDLANTGQVCVEDSECPEIGGTKTSCLPVSSQDTPNLPASLEICQ